MHNAVVLDTCYIVRNSLAEWWIKSVCSVRPVVFWVPAKLLWSKGREWWWWWWWWLYQWQWHLLLLQNFVPSISCPDDISSKLNIQVKAVEPVLDAGAQIQQMVNAECIEDFVGEYEDRLWPSWNCACSVSFPDERDWAGLWYIICLSPNLCNWTKGILPLLIVMKVSSLTQVEGTTVLSFLCERLSFEFHHKDLILC